MTWWRFVEDGAFQAWDTERIGRLYLPLANEAGMLSWTSPRLHGGGAISHHEYLTPPLTAEDLPHATIHRDVWLVEPGCAPFAASGPGRIDAGIGWFSLTRHDPAHRFSITVTLWCPSDVPEPIELMRVVVRNTSKRPLAFLPYAAIPLFCRSADHVRDHRHVTTLLHRMRRSRHGVTVQPTMSFDERGHRLNTTRYTVLAFGPRGAAPTDVWALEDDFLGEGGTFAAPAAVWRRQRAPTRLPEELSGREAIGGFRFAPCRLAPGASAAYLVLSGIAKNARKIHRWASWAKRPEAVEQSLARTKTFWIEQARRVSFSAADPTLNHWLAWVNVQPVLRRLYGNSYLPQFDYGRGGRGWRDLWQDGLALLLSDPAAVRLMLLHAIGGARIDGSNATIIARDGGFIADRNNIPRTWMDHGAWPTHATLLYVDHTGDAEVLFAERPYFRDPQLFRCRRRDERWTEADGFHLRARRGTIFRGSVLQHLLIQNLTAFFNVGEHNVCRLEGADWNDGLDMAVLRGESVAFTALYAWNLKRLAELAEMLSARGRSTLEMPEEAMPLLDRLPGQRRVNYASAAAKRTCLEQYLQRVARDVSGRVRRARLSDLSVDLREKYEDLARRIRRQEWIRVSGEGWFNGYYDNKGRRVEGRHSRGVRMTLTGQVFPLMAGIATEEQVDAVICAVNRFLRDPATGGIRLNTDFGAPQPALGRAFAFAYGEKENGAVFSHMAVMYAYALYLRRRPAEGRAVWQALYRMATNQPVAKIFPCLPEYFNREGRGMYCYLTGSASWLVFLLLTQAYGIRGELGALVIDPQLTREEFGSRSATAVETSFAGRRLAIEFSNPKRLEASAYNVVAIRAEGIPLPFTPHPRGGVRIARARIERLPAHRRIVLRVRLG